MSPSNPRTLFIVTGVAAWLGGLATAFSVSSCDVDPCGMNPDDPQCQPDPYADRQTPGSAVQRPPPECDYAARPSVHVAPVRRLDDYFTAVEVDAVWFQHDGQTHEALCITTDTGCIGAWIAGYELEGPITVFTEYCDTVVSQTVEVGRTADDCHVQTEFMLLEVSTAGCLTAPEPSGPPPPPPGPWTLTTEAAPS